MQQQPVKPTLTLLTVLLLAPLAALHAADKPSLLPANWDPALAGDIVMQRLVKVTAPQVKGAHDAEFVCVGERAYVVSEVNDLKGGEDGAWPFIYSTLSIVNLKTLKTERVIDFVRGEQVFANETLPVGACWVPRILQKDAQTLRCYIVSQAPGQRQSQMWYRDFDLGLKTAAGTFDFQPPDTGHYSGSVTAADLGTGGDGPAQGVGSTLDSPADDQAADACGGIDPSAA